MDYDASENYQISVPDLTLNDIDLYSQILHEKESHPSEFISYWELDEEVNEATEEQIKDDPEKRMLWAAEHNHVEIVTELIEKNAALVCCKDDDGYTPLHRAAYSDNVDIAEMLLSSGADIEARTDDGWTPLHSASFWNNTVTAQLLLDAGCNINAQTNGQQTALHLAASQPDHKDILKLLLMQPCIDAKLENKVGETAYQICRRISNLTFLFEIADDSVNSLKLPS